MLRNASKIALCAFLLCCAASGYAQTSVHLTTSERAEIWRSLGRRADKTQEPAGLQVGEAVPDTMHMLAFARHVRKKVPALKSYSYALLHGQVLIVDPGTKTIVSIVSK
jgi:Protein of unknown function (DUF1236)